MLYVVRAHYIEDDLGPGPHKAPYKETDPWLEDELESLPSALDLILLYTVIDVPRWRPR